MPRWATENKLYYTIKNAGGLRVDFAARGTIKAVNWAVNFYNNNDNKNSQ
jgi:hypothetical protein